MDFALHDAVKDDDTSSSMDDTAPTGAVRRRGRLRDPSAEGSVGWPPHRRQAELGQTITRRLVTAAMFGNPTLSLCIPCLGDTDSTVIFNNQSWVPYVWPTSGCTRRLGGESSYFPRATSAVP
jgi:hypothetical protein